MNIGKFFYPPLLAFFIMITGSDAVLAYNGCLEPVEFHAQSSGRNLNKQSLNNITKVVHRRLHRKLRGFMRRERFDIQAAPTYTLRMRCKCHGSPWRVRPGDHMTIRCSARVTICPGSAKLELPDRCYWRGWR